MKYNIEIDGEIVKFPHLQNLTLDQAVKLIVTYSSRFTSGALLAGQAGNELAKLKNNNSRQSIKLVEVK